MSSNEPQSGYEDVLTTHNYDGIQEYDNPMPAWWTWIFVATVIWSGVYLVGLEFDIIPDVQDDLRAEMKIQRQIEAQMAAEIPPVTPEMLAEAANSEAVVEAGDSVFAMNCAACHGAKGQGQIGPNLTDNAWIHGNDLTDIHRVIEEGVTAKGMPAWGPILGREDMLAVVAYVEAMKGTNVEGGKAPEGEVIGDAPEAPAGEDAPGDDPEGAAGEAPGDAQPAEADPATPEDGENG